MKGKLRALSPEQETWLLNNPLWKWRRLRGISRNSLIELLKEDATRQGKTSLRHPYTAELIRRWERGWDRPWLHISGWSFVFLCQRIGVEEDDWVAVWNLWYAAVPEEIKPRLWWKPFD